MPIAYHTLSDVELLRAARTSPLMEDPLFAEFVDRMEQDNPGSQLRELKRQQTDLTRHDNK